MRSGNPTRIFPNYKKYEWGKDFSSLDAWKKSQKLKLYLYRQVIPNLPVDEKYNLSIQIKRASISITANIAEGYGRYHFREAIQFYRIARGSLYEIKDHLISCHDLGFIDSEVYSCGLDMIESAKTTLNGFINFVKNKMDSELK